jgi:hypothetical protein
MAKAASQQRSRTGAFLRNLALYLIAFTFVLAWLPLVRSIVDGPTYEWGTGLFDLRFSGAGTGGDFWFLIVQAALALSILYLGFRSPGRLFYALLVGWAALNAAHYGYGLVTAPSSLVFEGETLGVSLNIGVIAFALYAAVALLTILAAQLENAKGRRPPRFSWKRGNTVALVAALALLPIQFVLLRSGAPHARADEIGVLLTMAQWVAIVYALAIKRRGA